MLLEKIGRIIKYSTNVILFSCVPSFVTSKSCLMMPGMWNFFYTHEHCTLLYFLIACGFNSGLYDVLVGRNIVFVKNRHRLREKVFGALNKLESESIK